MTTTKKEREETRALHAATTPGQWREHYDYRDGKPDGVMIGAVAPGHRILTDHKGGTYPNRDLEFIAHAHTDIPRLLEDVERRDKLLKYAQDRIHADICGDKCVVECELARAVIGGE